MAFEKRGIKDVHKINFNITLETTNRQFYNNSFLNTCLQKIHTTDALNF